MGQYRSIGQHISDATLKIMFTITHCMR